MNETLVTAFFMGIAIGYVIDAISHSLWKRCVSNEPRDSVSYIPGVIGSSRNPGSIIYESFTEMRENLRPIRCIFCDFSFDSIPDLKHHSAKCSHHPANKELLRLAGDLDEIVEAIRGPVRSDKE